MSPTPHLPDDLLQEYAATAPPSEAAAHLRSCLQCQARVRHYQALFAALAAAPRPAFAFDLAAAVLAQLPAPAPKRQHSRAWMLLAVLLPLVVAPVVWFWAYFAGLFRGAAPGLLLVLLPTTIGLLLLLAGERLLTYQRHLAALRPA